MLGKHTSTAHSPFPFLEHRHLLKSILTDYVVIPKASTLHYIVGFQQGNAA